MRPRTPKALAPLAAVAVLTGLGTGTGTAAAEPLTRDWPAPIGDPAKTATASCTAFGF